MSDRVTVVGSGASAVHFAQSVLDKGYEVTMIDAGRTGELQPLPTRTFGELKDELDDPAAYFLGSRYEGVVLPDAGREFYGIPPGRQFALAAPDWTSPGDSFQPVHSLASGGLAEVWTGGCYPFNDHDLRDFPFGHKGIRPFYDLVAARIGVSGEQDDLARFMPVHANLLAPLRLDEGSRLLLQAYARQRHRLNHVHRAWVGRTRVATRTEPAGDRQACDYLGRCLWGCPRRALYTPSMTLEVLRSNPRFRYVPGRIARHFTFSPAGRASVLVCHRPESGEAEALPLERLVLAAGTLGSAAIVLRSLREATGASPRLTGLMDNRQVLVPFLQLRMLGRRPEPRSYQYHMVGMGIEGGDSTGYVHCQVTTLKTALVHPILQRLPFDFRTAIGIGRSALGALGVVNVNFADDRRSDCEAWLEDDRLHLQYSPPEDEPIRLAAALRTVRRVLRTLGCIVPPGMQHVRPMGASAHYAGLFPMSRTRASLSTTPEGRSWDIENIYLADGSTFPALPSKNLTFTLMANAARIAAVAF